MKIDYQIYIGIEGLSYDKKLRVIDAFYSLGIEWGPCHNGSFDYIESAMKFGAVLTNTNSSGKVFDKIMCLMHHSRTTHTYDQLMELAGMTEANAKLSDLSSDAMLKRFNSNQDEIVRLTLENNELVALVRANGFLILGTNNAARVAAAEARLDALDVPLSSADLKSGGWWMSSATKDDGIGLVMAGVVVRDRHKWGDGNKDLVGCASKGDGAFRINKYYLLMHDSVQIHRRGDAFYWGAPE